MKLKELAEDLNLRLLNPGVSLDRETNQGYICDLLSNVIANAPEGSMWITIQRHSNIIAVAVLKNLAGIILTQGVVPEKNTLNKAIEEEIPLFSTPDDSFEVAGKIYQILLNK